MAERQVLWSDVERAIESRDPQLADLIIRFAGQGDPPPGRPEVDEATASEGEAPPPSPDAWTLPRLQQMLSPGKLASMTGTEQKAARLEAWEALLASENPPPRLRLGAALVALYEAGDEPARSALVRIFLEARVRWGLWQAMRRVYKLAEARHDAQMFGAIGCRLDMLSRTPRDATEVGDGSALYFRRRVWRYLRQLGQAVPALYVEFVAQVLRHYPSDFSCSQAWVASQAWGHKKLLSRRGDRGLASIPKDLGSRAFADAWKVSPAPLLRLLEDAANDMVCEFAIRSLQKDFPEVVRRPEPAWLSRLGQKRLATVDTFLVEVLASGPELHQSKLRGLGLHELALSLLRSPSAEARKYAMEYARTHAPDMPVAELLALLDLDEEDVRAFVIARLTGMAPKLLGLPALARLLDERKAAAWAGKALREAFAPADFDASSFALFFARSDVRRDVIVKLYADAKVKIPVAFLQPIAADPDADWDAREAALSAIGARDGVEIGLDWAKRHLDRAETEQAIKGWVRAGKWSGAALDVEWLAGLVLRPRHRDFALEVLARRDLIAVARLGLGWLLEMARRPEENVRSFAASALLEGFAPTDFSPGRPASEGIDRLFALASGPGQPDAVRAFAATYLKVHHPDLHRATPEARQHAVTPKLDHDAYSRARVEPLLDDARPDVRRLGVAIGKHEIARWGDPAVLYAMVESRHAEVRSAGAELLGAIGAAERSLPVEWLDAARVFTLAESGQKATREAALDVIRRHYEKLGSVERLGWLMDSPERDVQIFAVRLLWERHAPRATPVGWKPREGRPTSAPVPVVLPEGERFDSEEALRGFLRTLLFGVPPGRMERREGTEGARRRPLPASVAKRRAVEAARDLAIADVGFASAIVPVLNEMTASEAKGEWQACVAALAAIRRAHPQAGVALPPPIVAAAPAKAGREGARRDGGGA